jgi:putative DNA primase/helicase
MTDDVVAFLPYANDPIWLAWALESKVTRSGARGLPAKVPYAATKSGGLRQGFGSSTNPETWGVRAQAEIRAQQLLGGNVTVTGLGIALGNGGDDGWHRAGIDLDSSINDGLLPSWASAILDILQTYSEVSPSGTGIKAFFMICTEHVRPFLDLIKVDPDAWGTKRGIPGFDSGNHGPAVEIYTAERFFTVTEQQWSPEHSLIALLDWPQLEALAKLIPAGIDSGSSDPASTGTGSASGPVKPSRGPDNSRSARALTFALRREYDSYDRMVAGLRRHPDQDVRDWVDEKGERDDERELKRIWKRFCEEHAVNRAIALTAFQSHQSPVETTFEPPHEPDEPAIPETTWTPAERQAWRQRRKREEAVRKLAAVTAAQRDRAERIVKARNIWAGSAP